MSNLVAAIAVDALGLDWSIGNIGGLTAASGLVVAAVMYETLPVADARAASVPPERSGRSAKSSRMFNSMKVRQSGP